MFTYTFSRPCTRTPRNPNSRTSFAHEAVYEEFRPRDARALDQADFVDRAPNETPPLAAEVLARLELLGVEAAE